MAAGSASTISTASNPKSANLADLDWDISALYLIAAPANADIREEVVEELITVTQTGRLLTECKAEVGHGNFGDWLDREFGWHQTQATKFMQVYELSGGLSNLLNLDWDISALYLLAAPAISHGLSLSVILRGTLPASASPARLAGPYHFRIRSGVRPAREASRSGRPA